MSEKNPKSKPVQSTAIRALRPVEADGHNIGVALADEAALAEAGTEGATAQSLEKNWQRNYTLGRNAVEDALGSDAPYAQDQLKDEGQK